MKSLTITLIILILSHISFGQVSDTTQINLYTSNNCGGAQFQLYGHYNNDELKVFHIDFGNNKDTTLFVENYATNDVNFALTTAYVYSGNYTVSVTVETDSGVLLDQQSFDFLIEGAENCTHETIYKIRNPSSFQTYFLNDTIPIDFTGIDGITHTIYPTNSLTNYLTNPLLYPAQITANPDWLIAHNKVQLNPPLPFSSPQNILSEFIYALGWPTLIILSSDIVNENNLLFINNNSSNIGPYTSYCNLIIKNTPDAVPDSLKRIRVEYDPFLQIEHDSLLNLSEGAGFLEFDVIYSNFYRPVRFGLTASAVQTLDSIYFKCFYLNNTDQNATDDTTTLYFNSIDPCFGLNDSVLNISLGSFSMNQNNRQVATGVSIFKNICSAVDSISLTVHHSPTLILGTNSQNTYSQFTQINDSTLNRYISIHEYSSNQYIQLFFTLEGSPSEYTYVNYSIDLVDDNLTDNLIGDTLNILFCDSIDFSISSLSAIMIAPTQSGNCAISPLMWSSCLIPDTTEIRITFPGYVTIDPSALVFGTFTDSTFHLFIDWTNQNDYFQIPFHIPGNIPSGTTYTITSKIVNNADIDSTNNLFSYNGIVLNSYDPNEKRSSLPKYLNPNIREKITYTVHFQNDGNLEAYNIAVRDTISSNMDLTTFRFLGSSHLCEFHINEITREITFNFPEIMLSPSESDLLASQGIFSYEISELPNLPLGTEIENTAYIYFDFNPPIVTNTTYNINELPLGLSENKTEQIVLYPNPAQNKLHFSGSSVKKVSIYDLTGKRVLEEEHISANELSLSSLQTGIYQVVLQTENTISTQKLVIQK